MDKKKVIELLEKIMHGDDWVLTEMEKGIILLQRKSNKVKGKFTNFKPR